MTVTERAAWILDAALSLVTVLLLAASVSLVILAVFMRYVAGAPLTYSYDLTTLLFAWVIFLGLAMAERDGAHLAVDLTGALPDPVARWLAAMRQVFNIALSLFVMWITWRLFRRAGMTMPSLMISVKWLYASAPIGFALLALAQALALADSLRARRSAA